MGDGDDFIEKERQAAENLRDALRNAAVKQVIFLGALQPNDDSSPHLTARRLTGEILRQSGVPVTELRAGIVVGPGSAAFEVMRDMVYNLPVLTPPRWVRSKSSPVALENLLVYLADLLAHLAQEHRIFDVAGPEYLSYQDMFKRFIALSGKRRWLIPIPLPTRLISVWFISLITSVPTPIARALIQGLKHDLPADGRPLQALIPQRLHTLIRRSPPRCSANRRWSIPPTGATIRRRGPAGAPATVTIRNRPVVRWTPPPPARPCGKRCSSWGAKKAISTPIFCGASAPAWTT